MTTETTQNVTHLHWFARVTRYPDGRVRITEMSSYTAVGTEGTDLMAYATFCSMIRMVIHNLKNPPTGN